MTIATLTVNAVIDASCHVGRIVPNRKLRCSEPILEPGGGGINVATVIERLGGTCKAFWTCGGLRGEQLERLLDQAGITHEKIPISGETRQNLVVGEDDSDQQYRFVTPGPTLTPEEADSCLRRLAEMQPPPEYVVLSGSLPPGLSEDFYGEAAQRSPGRAIVDTSGPPLKQAIKRGVYLIKPNMRELSQLVGSELEDDSQVEAAARALIDGGKVEVVVCSLGSGGALLVTSEQTHQVRAPTVPIRSRVGAGDSTVAGIVYSLAIGRDLLDAVRFGVAAGAATVMTPGTELCHREDVERLYNHIEG